MQLGITREHRLDIPQAVALAEMAYSQGNELTPPRQRIAAPAAIVTLSQFLKFKSRDGLEELREYGRMISHSPVSCFQSMVCGELIVSKSPTIPGYLVGLSGTAVGTSPITPRPLLRPLAGLCHA